MQRHNQKAIYTFQTSLGICLLLVFLIGSVPFFVWAQEEEGPYAFLFDKVESFVNDHPAFEGSFTLRGANEEMSSGYFYGEGTKFKLLFGTRDSIYTRRIIFTGTRLWIYEPNRNLVIDQDIHDPVRMHSGRAGLMSIQSLGLRPLLLDYTINDEISTRTVQQIDGIDEAVYVLIMVARHPQHHFKQLTFCITEQGFIARTTAITNEDKTLTFTRSDLTVLDAKKEGQFTLRAPEDAWVIKNPILSVGEGR